MFNFKKSIINKTIKMHTSASDTLKEQSNEPSSKAFSSPFSTFELLIKSNSNPASDI